LSLEATYMEMIALIMHGKTTITFSNKDLLPRGLGAQECNVPCCDMPLEVYTPLVD